MDDDFEMYDEEEYNSKFSTNNDVQNENINSYQNSGLESEIYTGANNQNNVDGQNINEFLSQNYSSLGNKDEDIISSDDDNIDLNKEPIMIDNQDYNIQQSQSNNMLGSQIVNEFLSKNKEEDSVLSPMYEEPKNDVSYEDELKTATPIEEKVSNDIQSSPINNSLENPINEESIKEPNRFINNSDFMNYDPMLQNGLETDGDYVISTFDSNSNNDYVPEKTSFDTEGVMESYKEENVEPEIKIEPIEQVEPEVYNTSGMMHYEENNIDTFNSPLPEMKENNKFIFTDINNGEDNNRPIPQIEDMPNTVGAIPIYDKQEATDKDTKDKNASKKALEMVATVIFFALLILIVSFFPEINKFFNNLIK